MRKLYGKKMTNKLLLRIFVIEKKLKYMDYETINTHEYFFLLYYVMSNMLKYMEEALLWENIDYTVIHPVAFTEVVAYVVYSYFGPNTEYPFKMFRSHIKDDKVEFDYKQLIVSFILNSNFSQQILLLNTNTTSRYDAIQNFLTASI